MKDKKGWALIRRFDWGDSLLGKFCWIGARSDDFNVRIFNTRQEARNARSTCCYKDAKPVKVIIKVVE